MKTRRTSISYRRGRHGKRHASRSPRGLPLPLMLIGVFLVAGTLMYLTARTVTLTNTFTVGKSSIQIVEPDVNPDAVEWGTNTKPVQLRNPNVEGNAAGAVRAMLVPYLTDAEDGSRLGGSLGEISAPTGNQMVLGDLTFHFASNWSSNWFYQDGFFYYRKVLKPGEETPLLLTGVTLADGKDAEYENIRVRVEVLADILQAEGGASSAEWNVNISGDNVSP